jgi:hypothetical protein
MKEANIKIFSTLEEFVIENAEDLVLQTNVKRYIRTDASDKQWLKRVNFEKRYDLNLLRFSTFSFENKSYFLVFGCEKSVNFESILEEENMNAGLFTALISDLEIPVKKDSSSYEIVDEILFFSADENANYSGHDFESLEKFFEPILLYRLKDESPFGQEDIFNLAGYFLVKNNAQLPLKFSSLTILQFEKIFIEGVSTLPYENLIYSLTSVHWKYSFLDAYRCLEALFPFLKLDDLHQRLEVSMPLYDFACEVESIISWKPKEDESVQRIINKAPPDSIKLLNEVRELIDGDTKSLGSNFYYKIRNSVVHYRPVTQQPSISDECWDKLIRATLEIIQHWYTSYDSKLSILSGR